MTVDKTHLSIDTAEKRGFLHRDYIAHCHRWSYVAKVLMKGGLYKKTTLLDIGCGVDLPLARTLFTNRMPVKQYIGLDANKDAKFVDFNFGKQPTATYADALFPEEVELDGDNIAIGMDEYDRPNVITCFEVLEHVPAEHAVRMLRAMRMLLAPGGFAIISTPCYDAKTGAAANHMNEMTRDALGSIIESCDFQIDGNWGTFASQKDYKPHMSFELKKIFAQLSAYYDSNLVATTFAPLFPEYSRNNLWHISAKTPEYEHRFPSLDEVAQPWASGDDWQELAWAEAEEEEDL